MSQSERRICDCCERCQRPDEPDEGWMIHPIEGIDLCPDCLAAVREWEAQRA